MPHSDTLDVHAVGNTSATTFGALLCLLSNPTLLQCTKCHALQADKDAREDRLQRDPDYDSHLGIERDPITREITHVAAST